MTLLVACQRDLPQNSHPVAYWEPPKHFPEPHYTFAGNEKDEAVYELGRALFFDPILSLDSTISCASCHRQHLAFSDSVKLSTGIKGRLSRRNSPPLFNLAWSPSFMWDGGINHIEVVSIAPITDSFEMALPLRVLGERLNNHPFYKSGFKKAMGSDSITDRQYLLALTQFMSAIISDSSPYDDYILGRAHTMSVKAIEGLKLFRIHCEDCHKEPLFTDFSFRNNGTFEPSGDLGRFLITDHPADRGSFKVPSLRNIALTAPYMHDGRFNSLEEVIEHYTSDLSEISGVDTRLKDGIHLDPVQKDQLLVFLQTLTDSEMIIQPAFSHPKRGN